MRELHIDELNSLYHALSDVIGYLADNSCGDPDCCGGPFYEKDHFSEGVKELQEYGLTVNEATVLKPLPRNHL